MSLSYRPIAMTDLETTGDVPSVHEILEIGLVLFDQKTLEIIETLNLKVKPEHIETAVPAALLYNGYDPEKWQNALSLADTMRIYGEKTYDAIFCSYNVSFDWSFIVEGFHKTNLPNPMSTKDNHDRLDLLTLAWSTGPKDAQSLSLKATCKRLGIDPEQEPHSAGNGAMTAYKVWKKLSEIEKG